MSAHDVLFNPEYSTILKTDTGAPIPVPTAGDISNVAQLTSEAQSRTSTDIAHTGQAEVGAYSYSSKFVFSVESVQDLRGAYSVYTLAKSFFADRFARGAGADLMVGSGVNRPKGLITTLESIGVSPVVATGSATNTGGAETSSNSIGSADMANLLESLDSAYLDSPKTAFCMNRKTLGKLNALVSKMGTSLDLVKYVNGKPYIYGVPVAISPSMADVSPSSVSVILGDFSYWVTRLVMSENLGMVISRESEAESGKLAIVCLARLDGTLAYTDTSSPAPFTVLQQTS
jgi:HK97 family phage major capsid protein